MKNPTPGDIIKSTTNLAASGDFGGGGKLGGSSGGIGSKSPGLSQTFKKPKTLVCYIW